MAATAETRRAVQHLDNELYRRVLKPCLPFIRNKSVNQLVLMLDKHDPDDLQLAAEFMEHPNTLPNIIKTVYTRMRYDSSIEFEPWIREMTDHYDEAMRLRAQYYPQQTYSSLSEFVRGLTQYRIDGVEPSREQKSALLAAGYAARFIPAELLNQNIHRSHMLIDDALVRFIAQRSADSERIQELMVTKHLTRPAELEQVLDEDAHTAFISGAL